LKGVCSGRGGYASDRFKSRPRNVEALRTTYNAKAVPRVRACPGNVACLLLEPVQAGDPFVAVTTWKTRADGEAYDAGGTAAEVVSLVRGYFAGPPTLRSYESAATPVSGSWVLAGPNGSRGAPAAVRPGRTVLVVSLRRPCRETSALDSRELLPPPSTH